MNIEIRNEKLKRLKSEINLKLIDLNFQKKKELVLWLTKDTDYQRLKETDNQLFAMEFWKNVWLEEIQNPDAFEMQGDAFAEIASLQMAEQKYLAIRFAVLRIAENVPYDYCMEVIEQIENYKVSAYAWFAMLNDEKENKEKLVMQLASLFVDRNDLIKAIGILQLGVKSVPDNKEIKLMLADIWLSIKQWKKAYECLLNISHPTTEIQELMRELESVIANETV